MGNLITNNLLSLSLPRAPVLTLLLIPCNLHPYVATFVTNKTLYSVVYNVTVYAPSVMPKTKKVVTTFNAMPQ